MSDEPVSHSKARKTVGYVFTFMLMVCVVLGTALFISLVQALLK